MQDEEEVHDDDGEQGVAVFEGVPLIQQERIRRAQQSSTDEEEDAEAGGLVREPPDPWQHLPEKDRPIFTTVAIFLVASWMLQFYLLEELHSMDEQVTYWYVFREWVAGLR